MNEFEQEFRVQPAISKPGTWVVDVVGVFCVFIRPDGTKGNVHFYPTEAEAQAALDLYLEKQKMEEQPERTFVGHLDGGLGIRTFDSGATRDTTQGKLDYVKALSPIVLRRYVQYLDKHRLQPDGSYRDFDNWKKGIPQETYHSSGGRHFFDAWLLTEGYTAEDNHGPVEIEDVLCAQLFNIMGRLHEVLKVKSENASADAVSISGQDFPDVDRTKPVPGGY